MTRILITNAYSARNKGDAAIVLGMIESLRSSGRLADAEIAISSADHPADAARYPVPVVASFHSLMRGVPGGPRLRGLYFLLVLLPASLVWAAAWRALGLDLPLPRALRRLLRRYAEADLVVAAGGGYLYTTSGIHGNVMLGVHLHSFLVGAALGRPVALYAQSVGPFAAPYQARMVRAALARVRLIEAREAVTYELLAGWRLPAPVHLVADGAFLVPASPPRSGLTLGSGGDVLTVGMTVRSWFRDPERQRVYERAVAAFVDRLVRECGAEVVFLPQVTVAEAGDDDRLAARAVVARLARPERVRVIEEELDAGEVKWLCGRARLFVGTRMHSNIFALSQAVPTVAVSYQPKTDGIMAQLGLGGDVVPIEEVSSERLWEAFESVRGREGEIRAHLRAVLPEIADRARLAGRLLADLLPGPTSGAGEAPAPWPT